ncbi:hypothetical protein ACTWQB_12075 [Piscibacillus sp. B03]|uniref:hypothetical protein n=1 Tax=Piscibacillus sp. B03 TaxID=3457430 RepID=UPI003FCD5FEE
MRKKKESDKVTAPTMKSSKKERILEQARNKFHDKDRKKNLIQAGGSLSTKQEFDVVEISKNIRGKE